jgi:hypothetical protein
MKFRYHKGVKYVAPSKPAPDTFTRCGHCRRAWDDSKSTALTPAPSGRCPFEYWHRADKPAKRVEPPAYEIEPECYAGEKLPEGATGSYVLSFGGNWLGTYRSKRAAMRARRDHNATRKSQHELARARIRDIDNGRA